LLAIAAEPGDDTMGPATTVALVAGLLMGAAQPPASPADVARLREMLHDNSRPRQQSQAALLLLQNDTQEAELAIRLELGQTNDPEVYSALVSAIRLNHDRRFLEELLSKLAGGQANIRQSAAEALAELADSPLLRRLQAVIEDEHSDRALRQLATWTLGQSGQQAAVSVLLNQLSGADEGQCQAAADALTVMTGLPYGRDLAGWRRWWKQHEGMSGEQWLEERLAFKNSQARRLEGELERAKAQIVNLHQQLYSRLPLADRLGQATAVADAQDAGVRALAVNWCTELWPAADAVGRRALAEILLRSSHDGAQEVQRLAVLALGRIDDPRTGERLCHLLQRGQPSIRAAAARALAQQARGSSPEALARQRQIVPALQKALEDPSLTVVAEAAESLGTLGVPEAGPVLAALLRHPSAAVRQTAALALERVAEPAILDNLIDAFDEPAVTVRFSLVGAIGHAAGDGRNLAEALKARLLARLEDLLVRDADPGVRSRTASVLGDCGTPAQLVALWRRVVASEDARVQEKAWSAFVEILARTGSPELLAEWEQTLANAKQPDRRVQLLAELASRWQQKENLRSRAASIQDALVQGYLDQRKWAPALGILHEILGRPTKEPDIDQRLIWLRAIAELALKDGNRPDALRAIQDARPLLARRNNLAAVFDTLEKQAKDGT
jgi:HEAT repeat protein